ncbi:MAG: SDR family oxidoreductase [Betaproteobacteria bacterium]|nr:SDR family oxidoreductase [Betaproteobacteria bacterium]
MATVKELMSLDGCVSVVTGGATGLGLQMATALAEAGSNVVISGRARIAPPEDTPLEGWQKESDLNITAPFICAQVLGREMIKAQRGSIINIASVAGMLGRDPKTYNSIAYCASKGALVNFTRDLAVKWAPHNIRVNAICPGTFVTTFNEKMFDRIKEHVLRGVPLGRTGGPDDLKGIVVLLASDASNFMTGAIIPVDGGAVAW